MSSFQIADRKVGADCPVFIIAELSANHNGKLENALRTIEAAKKAGADAIKLQTYTPDTITIDCKNEYFKIGQGTIWDGQYLYNLYQSAYTPFEWHEKLFKTARNEGLICFSSPFDHTAVDLLEELDTPAYKIASFEIVDIPLIEYAASKQKPVIISTGIAALTDIEEALAACKRAGNQQVALLKCTSSYPAPLEEANLKTITDLQNHFDVVAGLSDHTLGVTAPVAATALGAKIIEKHFILDRSIGGPDASFSLDFEQFKTMVKAVREAEKAIGKVSYTLSEKTQKNRQFARSLFVVEHVKKGEIFTLENVRSIRPGYGLPPKELKSVIGKKATQNLERGTPLHWDFIAFK